MADHFFKTIVGGRCSARVGSLALFSAAESSSFPWLLHVSHPIAFTEISAA
jgi:hypothetical protein